MLIITLSYLNPYFRPFVFLKAPDSIKKEDLNQIPFLMQMYDTGFFKHMFATIRTANLMFEIPSEYSRTKKEHLLISIITDDKSKFNTSLTQELLEGFVEEFKKIDSAYKAFYINSEIYNGDLNKFIEIKKLVDTFYTTFPKKDVI
ncbi:MAG: hypothetical protein ACFE9R_15045, partial [Candidatus Hermodarchaeota archaeon]